MEQSFNAVESVKEELLSQAVVSSLKDSTRTIEEADISSTLNTGVNQADRSRQVNGDDVGDVYYCRHKHTRQQSNVTGAETDCAGRVVENDYCPKCGGTGTTTNYKCKRAGRFRTIIPLAFTVMNILEQQPNSTPVELHHHFSNIVCVCKEIGRAVADVVRVILQELGLRIQRNLGDATCTCCGDVLCSQHHRTFINDVAVTAGSSDKNMEDSAQGTDSDSGTVGGISSSVCFGITGKTCVPDPKDASCDRKEPSTAVQDAGGEGRPLPGKIFVGNIGYRQSWQDVKDFFSKFGKVSYVHMVFDHLRKLPRGIGFVEFADPEDAELCLMAEDSELVLEGRVLRVSRAHESKKTSFKLYPRIPEVCAANQVTRDTEESSAFGVHALPDVVWRLVFSYLTLHEQVRLERVCKRWREIAFHQWQGRQCLKCAGFSLMNPLTERVLGSLLQRCSDMLVELDLSAAGRLLSSYSMCIIGHYCPQLQKLDMTGVNATNLAMRDLSDKTRNLKWIRLHRCLHVGEKGLWWLFKNCQDLEFVDVSNNAAITGKCFYMLGPQIRTMILNGCNNLTDFAILTMAKKCSLLEDLQIQSCGNLTDAALTTVTTMRNLRKLVAGGTFGNASVEPWKKLGALHKLDYLKVDFNSSISDAAVLSTVGGCPHLSFLNLSGCGPYVSDESITQLAELSCLHHLNVSYLGSVTSTSLLRVAESCPLHSLLICACPSVDDQGVSLILQTCCSLRLLDLSGNLQLGKFCLRVYSHTDSIDPPHSVDVVIGGTSILQEDEVLDVPDNFNIIRDNRSSHHLHPDYLLDLPVPWDEEEGEGNWEGPLEGEGVVEGHGERVGEGAGVAVGPQEADGERRVLGVEWEEDWEEGEWEGDGKGFEGVGEGFEGNGEGFEGVGEGFEGNGEGFEGVREGFEGNREGFEGVGEGFEGNGEGFEGVGKCLEGDGESLEGVGDSLEEVREGLEGVGVSSEAEGEFQGDREEGWVSDRHGQAECPAVRDLRRAVGNKEGSPVKDVLGGDRLAEAVFQSTGQKGDKHDVGKEAPTADISQGQETNSAVSGTEETQTDRVSNDAEGEEIWEGERGEEPWEGYWEGRHLERERGTRSGAEQAGNISGHHRNTRRVIPVAAGYEESDDDLDDFGEDCCDDFLDFDDPQAMERWEMS